MLKQIKSLPVILFIAICMCSISPPPVAADPWTFVVMGDTRATSANDQYGYNVSVIEAMAKDIAALKSKPLAVVMVGDLVVGDLKGTRTEQSPDMGGMLQNWKDGMDPVYKANIPVYPIRGNHETYTSIWNDGKFNNDPSYWHNVFGSDLPQNGPATELGLTYYVMINNSLFLLLDNYTYNQPVYGQPDSTKVAMDPQVNNTWVSDTLKALAGQYTNLFVFGHAPLRQDDIATVLGKSPDNRNEFLNTITSAGCTTYFCGHDHFYALSLLEAESGGPRIYQDLVGASGANGTGTNEEKYGYGTPDKWDEKYKNDAGDSLKPVEEQYYRSFGYAVVTVDGTKVTQVWRSMDLKTGVFSNWPGSTYTLSSLPASNLKATKGMLTTHTISELDKSAVSGSTDSMHQARVRFTYRNPLTHLNNFTKTEGFSFDTLPFQFAYEWTNIIPFFNKQAWDSSRNCAANLARSSTEALECRMSLTVDGKPGMPELVLYQPPAISSLVDGSGAPTASATAGDLLTLTGSFLGSAPTVGLEYKRFGMYWLYKLSLDQSSFVYPNARGDLNASCMDPNTGKSYLAVKMPQIWPKWWDHGQQHNLVVGNGVSKTFVVLHTQ